MWARLASATPRLRTSPSSIPVKVGMALTAHKTVTMFMRYVHTEDNPVRKAAELVASRRKSVVGTRQEPKEVTT